MSDSIVKSKIEPKLNLKEPSLYKVIYINDEITTVEFVVRSLVEVFHYSEDAALDLAGLIHTTGSAVVAVLPYELAEQKGVEVTIMARNNGFPLQIKLEPDA
ncbi:MAG: ATP-dependent Clp protease adaptor ClpS [Fischerella sp.]|nr:ATP-dependent Clp protease adaptor ClpS [Fischerella sp.]